MACIYHIYSTEDDSKVYIGQTIGNEAPENSTQNEKEGKRQLKYASRPMDHFSGLYSDTARNRENTMFFNYILSHPLHTMVVEIYTIDNNFGLGDALEEFLEEWHPEHQSGEIRYSIQQLKEGQFKTIAEQGRKLRSIKDYLDAAEILHNYIATRIYGKTCLTHQIGGQGLTFISNNGVVLNSTVDVPTGCSIIDSNDREMARIQKHFVDEIKKGLNTPRNGKTFVEKVAPIIFKEAVAQNVIKGKRKKEEITNYTFTKATRDKVAVIFAEYIKNSVENIYNNRGRNYNYNDYEVHTNFDNLLSEYVEKWTINFSHTKKGSFNIVNAIMNILLDKNTAEQLVKGREKGQSYAETLAQDILNQELEVVLPQISISNFIYIIPKKEKVARKWNYTSGIKHYAKEKTDDYGISFRYRAYFFAYNLIKECIQENASYKVTNTYVNNDKYYFRVAMYRLVNAFRKKLKKVHYPLKDNDLEIFIHEVLTIYTSNQGTTLEKAAIKGIETINGIKLLVVDKPYEVQDKVGLLAYRFSDETAEIIEEWKEKSIAELTVF